MTVAVFAALADPSRLEMVSRLSREGPLTTGALTGDLGITRQAAERHLSVLETSGLVRTRRTGRLAIRELDTEALNHVTRWMEELGRAWDERLSRLEAGYASDPIRQKTGESSSGVG